MVVDIKIDDDQCMHQPVCYEGLGLDAFDHLEFWDLSGLQEWIDIYAFAA
jgi:hypothetical protein